jgi:hypothetical protein
MGLRVSDVDFDLDVLLVLGKGRRERALPLGRKASLALDRYLRARVRHKDADLPWLWLGCHGRLTEWGLVHMLRRRGEQPACLAFTRTSSATPCPRVACPWRRRDGPDAPGRLEIARDVATLRRLRRRRPRP